MRTLILAVLICYGASQMFRGSPKAMIEEEQAIFQAEQEDQSFYVGDSRTSTETLQGEDTSQVEGSLVVFKEDEQPMVYVEESIEAKPDNQQFEQTESLKIEKIEDAPQALPEATEEKQNYVQAEKAVIQGDEEETRAVQNTSTDVVLNIAPKTESLSSSEANKKHVYVYNPLAKKPFIGIRFPPMPVSKDHNYLSNSEPLTVKLPPWSEQSNHKVEDDLEFFQFIRPSDVSVNEY